MARNSGSEFWWPARPSAAMPPGARGARSRARLVVHGLRMLFGLWVFLAISMTPARNALAEDVKESLAPKIVQEMQCGSHKVVIPCGKYRPGEEKDTYHPMECAHNPLKFIDAKGRGKLVPGFGEKGASTESVVCGVGRHGRHYVEALIQDCGKQDCEDYYYLLGEDGSVIDMKGRDDTPDVAQDYDQIIAQNKIHFRGRHVEKLALMQCGSHRLVITCGNLRPGEEKFGNGDPQVCVHNQLEFVNSHGKVHVSKYVNSDPIDGWHADMLVCGRGAAGEYYVEVRYTSYPTCGACEFYVLFTESGRFVGEGPAAREANAAAKRYDRLWGKRKIKILN